jgi:hypothetical protein
VEQYPSKVMSFIEICLISIILIGTFLILFNYHSSNKIEFENDISKDNFRETPLGEIFLGFDHDSTKTWLNWIDIQDDLKKQLAYEKLVGYLARPPKSLGVITSEVVKAITAFKSKADAFDVIANLILKCRKHYKQFKTIDLFYEIAAVGLVKLNQEQAKEFLVEELNIISLNNELESLQTYLVRAVTKLDFNDELEAILSKILLSHEYVLEVRKELASLIDLKSLVVKERIYSVVLENFISSKLVELSEHEKTIFEIIFYQSVNLLNQDLENRSFWTLISKACDNIALQEIASKILTRSISTDSDLMSPDYLLELMNKEEPLRTIFMESCMNKFKILESEKEILKVSVKQSDLNLKFQYLKIYIEKINITNVVTEVLLFKYHELENIIKSLDASLEKKSLHTIAFFGSAFDEKIYLLRAYAANCKKSFVYIDIAQLLDSKEIIRELKSRIIQVKPCIVYINSFENVLNKDLEKKYSQNYKAIMKTIKELSTIFNVCLIAGISFSLQDLDNLSSDCLTNLVTNVSTVDRLELNMFTQKDKEEILSTSLKKIYPMRVECIENLLPYEVINYFIDFDLLHMIYLWNKYLQISLCAYGRLICLNEFIEHQPINPNTEKHIIENENYEAINFAQDLTVFENAKI